MTFVTNRYPAAGPGSRSGVRRIEEDVEVREVKEELEDEHEDEDDGL